MQPVPNSQAHIFSFNLSVQMLDNYLRFFKKIASNHVEKPKNLQTCSCFQVAFAEGEEKHIRFKRTHLVEKSNTRAVLGNANLKSLSLEYCFKVELGVVSTRERELQ